MLTTGHIRLHRSLSRDHLWTALTGEQFKTTVAILWCAIWHETEYGCPRCGEKIILPPGAIIDIKEISTVTGQHLSLVYRTIVKLERASFLKCVHHHPNKAIYVIKNYEKYHSNRKWIGNEQEVDRKWIGSTLYINKDKKINKIINNPRDLSTADIAPTTSTTPTTVSDKSLAYADKLKSTILKFKPNHRIATTYTTATRTAWGKSIDLLIKDGVTYERIDAVLGWLPTDTFWPANIQSGKKLREKFDQLESAMNRNRRVDINEAWGVKPTEIPESTIEVTGNEKYEFEEWCKNGRSY